MIILIEMIFIIAFGCVLHFTYEWAHHNKVVGWLSAVNESTWEHIKLAVLPSFLTIFFDYWTFGNNPNYWFAKFIMMLFSVVMIPAVFYLAEAVLKKASVPVDIMIFCLVVVYSVLVFSWIVQMDGFGFEIIGMIGIALIMAAFSFLTFFPIRNFLFIDPRNKKYGLDAHECSHRHSHKK